MLKLSNWSGFFLKVFLLTFPLQLQTLLYKSGLFSGEFNTFSSYFFLVSEGVLILSLFSYGLAKLLNPTEQIDVLSGFSRLETVMSSALIAVLIWSFTSVFWAGDKVLALLFSLRLLELLGLVFLILAQVLPREIILKYLFFGAAFQVLIGLGQYLKQGDLGLGILGESHISIDTLNVAKVDLAGEKILRAYGTFAHANIFGGYLVVCIGLLIQSIKKNNLWMKIPFLIVFMVGLLLSFSRSAWLALLAMIVVLLTLQAIKINWKQAVLTLAVLLFVMVLFSLDQVILARIINFSIDSFDQRLVFSGIAREMIMASPWRGAGLGNFVLQMSENYTGVLSPWLYQPVHNFFLMILSELGVIGFAFWLVIFGSSLKQIGDSMRRILKSERYYWKCYLAVMFGLLILSMLDHYLYTAWAGQVLVFLLLALVWKDYRDRRLELAK